MAYYAKHTMAITIGELLEPVAYATFYGPFDTTDEAAERINGVTDWAPVLEEWEIWDVDDEFPVPAHNVRKV